MEGGGSVARARRRARGRRQLQRVGRGASTEAKRDLRGARMGVKRKGGRGGALRGGGRPLCVLLSPKSYLIFMHLLKRPFIFIRD